MAATQVGSCSPFFQGSLGLVWRNTDHNTESWPHHLAVRHCGCDHVGSCSCNQRCAALRVMIVCQVFQSPTPQRIVVMPQGLQSPRTLLESTIPTRMSTITACLTQAQANTNIAAVMTPTSPHHKPVLSNCQPWNLVALAMGLYIMLLAKGSPQMYRDGNTCVKFHSFGGENNKHNTPSAHSCPQNSKHAPIRRRNGRFHSANAEPGRFHAQPCVHPVVRALLKFGSLSFQRKPHKSPKATSSPRPGVVNKNTNELQHILSVLKLLGETKIQALTGGFFSP
jgi:hypothetical protein